MTSLSSIELLRRLQAEREDHHAYTLVYSQVRSPFRLSPGPGSITHASEPWIFECANKSVPIYYLGPRGMDPNSTDGPLRSLLEASYDVRRNSDLLSTEYRDFLTMSIAYAAELPGQGRCIGLCLAEVLATHNAVCEHFAVMQQRQKQEVLSNQAWGPDTTAFRVMRPLFKSVVLVVLDTPSASRDAHVYIVKTGRQDTLPIAFPANMEVASLGTSSANTVVTSLRNALEWVASVEKAQREADKTIFMNEYIWDRSLGDPNKVLAKRGYAYDGPPITPQLLLQHRDPAIFPSWLSRLLRFKCPDGCHVRNHRLEGIPELNHILN